MIGYYTECRIGEVTGLTWSDIDLNNGTIDIKSSIKGNQIGILD
ncbi:MAG TPA: hypothetical protein VF941_10235 [Clostridia bacterium]